MSSGLCRRAFSKRSKNSCMASAGTRSPMDSCGRQRLQYGSMDPIVLCFVVDASAGRSWRCHSFLGVPKNGSASDRTHAPSCSTRPPRAGTPPCTAGGACSCPSIQPSRSRLRSPASLLSNLLVLVGGHLGRAYLLPVPAIPLSTKRLQLRDIGPHLGGAARPRRERFRHLPCRGVGIPGLRASGAPEGRKAAQAPWKAQAQEGKPGAQGQGAHDP